MSTTKNRRVHRGLRDPREEEFWGSPPKINGSVVWAYPTRMISQNGEPSTAAEVVAGDIVSLPGVDPERRAKVLAVGHFR
jgi:hypothetical protein